MVQEYNPWYRELKDQGCFNQIDTLEEEEAIVNNYTLQICTKMSKKRINLPPAFEAEETDIACFYWEYIQNSKFIRRVFHLMSQELFESLSPEKKEALNPRKLHRNGEPSSKRFWCLVPYLKLRIPQKSNWTHLRLHVTPQPNLYFLEFIDLAPKPADDVFIANTTHEPLYKETPIRWD